VPPPSKFQIEEPQFESAIAAGVRLTHRTGLCIVNAGGSDAPAPDLYKPFASRLWKKAGQEADARCFTKRLLVWWRQPSVKVD
jgi:hypothetical protein